VAGPAAVVAAALGRPERESTRVAEPVGVVAAADLSAGDRRAADG
jgi:hypothetical protein